MNLDLVKQSRYHPPANLGISETELCKRYENVFTSAVSDVLREMNYLYQALPHTVMPLKDGMKLAGIAFTIKGCKSQDIVDEMEDRAKMLESISQNSICIWDTCNDEDSAQWGEIMTRAAMKHGCRGAVVDGGVRDTDFILKLDFPVFCRYRTPNAMLGRFRMIGYQIPIRIGIVQILPGDVIFGDNDGVIVIPRDIALEVLERAESIRDNELNIKHMIEEGATPSDVVAQGGYF